MQAVGRRVESAVDGEADRRRAAPRARDRSSDGSAPGSGDPRRGGPWPQPATSSGRRPSADRTGPEPVPIARYDRTASGTRRIHRSTPGQERTMPNPYLHGNFAPVLDERSDDHELPVTGVIPPDLDGPAAAQRAESGRRARRRGRLPLVQRRRDDPRHRAGRRAGPTGYRNRWVRTRALAAKLETPTAGGPDRADRRPGQHPRDPPRRHHPGPGRVGIPPRPVARPRPGPRPRLRRRAGLAHDRPPQGRPGTGELVFFGYDVFGPPFLRYHVVDADGRPGPDRGPSRSPGPP